MLLGPFFRLKSWPSRRARQRLRGRFERRFRLRLAVWVVATRFHRPEGWLLLWAPCLWGLSIASALNPSYVSFCFYGLTTMLGAILMRSAGCLWNDFLDRELDRQTQRTRMRPQVRGSITPPQALRGVFFLLFLSGLLLWVFPPLVRWLAVSIVPLVFLYPLAKRVFRAPQLVLGLVYNWGAVLGYVALAGELAWPAFFLWAGGFFWTLVYDTVYAFQDYEDDLRTRTGSLASLLGMEYAKFALFLFAFLSGLCLELALYTIPSMMGPVTPGPVMSGWLGPVFLLGIGVSLLRVRLRSGCSCSAFFRFQAVWGLSISVWVLVVLHLV